MAQVQECCSLCGGRRPPYLDMSKRPKILTYCGWGYLLTGGPVPFCKSCVADYIDLWKDEWERFVAEGGVAECVNGATRSRMPVAGPP